MNILPEEFIERIRKDLGDEADSFLGSFFDEPKRGLRINPLKVGAGMEESLSKSLRQIPWEKHGYYYEPLIFPGKSPLHEAGAYYIQEPSAMAPVSYLDVQPGMCVLDLCAAPGGKSTQIASKLEGRGILIANEIISDRARVLSQNIERLGIKNALVLSHTPKELAERYPASFDRILVDAPCSGEGMMRRDETAVGEWSGENVTMCAKRQEDILDAASVMLKPGGRLVYSTCTFSIQENEGQIIRFLKKHPDYRAVKAAPAEGMRRGLPLTGGDPDSDLKGEEKRPNTELTDTQDMKEGMLRIWPQDGYGEGHFVAVLERTGGRLPVSCGYQGSKEPPLNNKQRQEIRPFKEFIADVIAEGTLKDHLSDPQNLFMFGKKLCALPEDGLPLLSGLKVIRAGLELGEIRKERFIPSHSLALAMKSEDAVRLAELNKGEAFDAKDPLMYLNGQTLAADEASLMKKDPATRDDGWTLATISGISAGWVKASKGILKNHYPKGLRINKAY